jgi:hypothetical protein
VEYRAPLARVGRGVGLIPASLRALSAVGVIPKEQPVDETFLRRHCAPTVHAVERIGEWLEARRA